MNVVSSASVDKSAMKTHGTTAGRLNSDSSMCGDFEEIFRECTDIIVLCAAREPNKMKSTKQNGCRMASLLLNDAYFAIFSSGHTTLDAMHLMAHFMLPLNSEQTHNMAVCLSSASLFLSLFFSVECSPKALAQGKARAKKRYKTSIDGRKWKNRNGKIHLKRPREILLFCCGGHRCTRYTLMQLMPTAANDSVTFMFHIVDDAQQLQ